MKIYNDSWIKDKRRAEIVPTHGESRKVKEGESLFNEPSLQYQSVIGNIPDCLKNENFVYTKLGAEIGFMVKKAGWVLVLGESEPDTESWGLLRFVITKAWGKHIFSLVAEFDAGELIPGYDRPMMLYAGWCEEGYGFQSIVHSGMTAIIFADTAKEYTPVPYEDAMDNNAELSLQTFYPLSSKQQLNDAYYYPENRGYQACPSVATTADGSIFVSFMSVPFGCTRAGGENFHGYVNLIRSRDGGINWQDPVTVFDPDKDGPCRNFEPMLWTSKNKKRLYLSYVQAAGLERNLGGCLGTWISYTDDPESDYPTWSTPVRIADGMSDSAPCMASDGNWYLPVAFSCHLSKDCYDMSVPEHVFGVHLYRSADCISWEHLCYVEKTCNHLSEPCIVEYEKGKLLMVERTPGGAHFLYSTLENPTEWTAPKKFCFDNNTGDMQMNTADSRNSLRVLPSGNILYLFNNSREKRRDNLSAALSVDGGKTFPYTLLIDERLNSTYSVADILPNGDIIIIYDQGRYRNDNETASEILYAVVTEEDIKKGEYISLHSCTKRLATRYGLAPREECFNAILNKLPAKYKTDFKDKRTLEDYKRLCEIFNNQ